MVSDRILMPEAFNVSEKQDTLSELPYQEYKHACGLTLLWLPKPGFVRKFASFGIPFGSIHQKLREENGQVTEIAAGSAHYLEHCIFSRDEAGGLLGKLSALGCHANAFTSYTQTVYYFSGTHSFAEAFRLYLQALLNPYLEEDRIEVERNIIGAELDMYNDDPDAFAFKQLMKTLYLKHGAREDIGGTRESIARINSENIKKIWSRFYSPANMRLVIVGDFEEGEKSKILEDLDLALRLKDWPGAAKYETVDEPPEVLNNRLELSLDVENSSFLLALKDPHPFAKRPLGKREIAARSMAISLYLDSVIGESTELYDELYGAGLINDSFNVGYYCEEDFAFLLLTCETERPEESATIVLERLRSALLTDKSAESLFSVQKKVALGQYLRALDSVESLGMTATQAAMSGLPMEEYANIINQASIPTAQMLLQFIRENQLCVEVLVKPREKNKL